jgi:hypothetical protein
MPRSIPIRLNAVPNDAVALLTGAHYRTAESVSDIINWCLTMFGKVKRDESLFWVPAGSATAARILVTPVIGTQTGRISAELTPLAWSALTEWRQRWRCEDDDTVARVAWLAPYFDRRDGRLACGTTARLPALRYLT